MRGGTLRFDFLSNGVPLAHFPEKVRADARRRRAVHFSVLEIADADFGVGRRSEMLPLQPCQHPPELAVADVMTSDKLCDELGQERRPLVFLERPGGIDDRNCLRFG